MLNKCLSCGRSLNQYEAETETDSVIAVAGEVDCCCGSFDEHNNYYDALCVDCCDSPQNGSQIWEGKSAGGGYYIVNPSY